MLLKSPNNGGVEPILDIAINAPSSNPTIQLGMRVDRERIIKEQRLGGVEAPCYQQLLQ